MCLVDSNNPLCWTLGLPVTREHISLNRKRTLFILLDGKSRVKGSDLLGANHELGRDGRLVFQTRRTLGLQGATMQDWVGFVAFNLHFLWGHPLL